MIPKTQDLLDLRDRILSAEADTRHKFQPQLSALMERCANADIAIPTDIRSLNDDLLEDAIEAQFDNMPV